MGMLHNTTDLDRLRTDCKSRGYDKIDEAIDIYKQYKSIKRQLEHHNYLQNQMSSNVKEVISDHQIEAAKTNKIKIKQLTKKLQDIEIKLQYYQDRVPNYLDYRVPDGESEKDNQKIKQHGEFYWHGKHHYDMPGYKQSSAGSRLPQLSGVISSLNRKLMNFVVDFLTTRGFQEYHLPVLFPVSHFKNTGHYSNPEQQIFHIEKDNPKAPQFALIPTSELSLLSLLQNKTLTKTEKYCSYSLCFRKEAGSAGKDNKGLIRSHQFTKVEMVIGALPNESDKMLDYMVQTACLILKKLGLSYRVMLLCSKDVGSGVTITYDIEVPIGGSWREVASLSSCDTKQAIGLKLKTSDGKYAHTLNGTALALDRIIAALMEKNYNPKTDKYDLDSVFKIIDTYYSV